MILNRKLAAAMFAIGIAATAGATSPASATTTGPAVTVAPATGLTDGQVVAVTVSGYGANESVIANECAFPSAGVSVCDWADTVNLTADSTGSGTTSVSVHASFAGTTQDGKPWGTVNCATVAGGCQIGTINAAPYDKPASTSISFQ
jgi:predicted short-subunit dehydrogenase-like oxidoreductase (DUF2520 family)